MTPAYVGAIEALEMAKAHALFAVRPRQSTRVRGSGRGLGVFRRAGASRCMALLRRADVFLMAFGAGIVARESFECAAKEGEATTLAPKISACAPTTPSVGRSMPMCLSKKSSLSKNANANGASAGSDSKDFFGMKRGDLWRIWKRYCVMATAWKADTLGPLQLWTWSLSCKNPRNAVAECGRGGAKDGLPPAPMHLRLQPHAAYRRLR